MSDEPGKEVLVHVGTAVEIAAEPIAQIIIQTCHCGVGRAERAADLIIDHLTAKLLASGAIEMAKPEGPVN